ncbi:hypothetical protein D918_07337 [Trichuris suis]|nr:hypothetical protein D918_07337 [Trichuris suis]
MNVEMKDEEQLLTPCVTSENAVSLSCSFAQRDTSFVVQKEVVAGSASTEMVAQVEHQSGTKLSPDVSSSEVQTNLFNMRGTEDLFATSVENVTQCRCGYQSSRADLYFVCALSYPTSDEQLLEKVSFEKLLEQSFHLEQVKHAWCEQCSKFRISTHRRWIRSLPDVLSINCNIDNDKIRSFWRRQQQLCVERPTSAGTAKSISSGEKLLESNFNASNGFGRLSWLPFNLHILLDADGKVTIYDRPKVGSDTGTASNAVFYELQAVISYIKSGTMGHWVACIKALSNDSIRRSRWYLVNDTQVNEIIPLEAVNFDVDWKVPCILLYSRPNLNELHPDLQCSPIDDRVFTLDRIISERPSNISTVSTKPACLPGRDDLVAIDAEFVTLNHISDYVTKFSGIKPGDLDPTFADRPLTAMKVAYLKLRYLIDVGVKFVGHGLSNDFKVINIYVRAYFIA